MGAIKVMHVITGLGVGGAETMLARLVRSSRSAQFEHVIVSMMDEGVIGRDIIRNGCIVHSLGMKPSRPTLSGILQFLRLLKTWKPNVIQTWLYHADLFGILALAVTRVPLIWNIRCTYDPKLCARTVKLCSLVSGLPSAVVANSKSGVETHGKAGYHPRRWEVITNGIDLAKLKPNPEARRAIRQEIGIGEDQPLIGLIARFHQMKDHATFFKAAAILLRSHRETAFLLAGREITKENGRLQELIHSHGLERNVHLLGERRDIPSLTAALDIATSASAYGEGFPNTVCEAMACGVPCVVTCVGDSADIVGDTGRVVPPGDAQALSHGWLSIIDMDSQARRRLGEEARKRISECFSLDKIIAQYENLYTSVSR